MHVCRINCLCLDVNAGKKWLAKKNTYTISHDVTVTAAGLTISECLSLCEQGFPADCQSVVFDSAMSECQFRNVSSVETPGFVLETSSAHDYYELYTEGNQFQCLLTVCYACSVVNPVEVLVHV